MLELWKFCPRASCARGRRCAGSAQQCVQRLSRFAPRRQREFIVDILNAKEFGHPPETALMIAQKESAARAANPAARS